VFTSTNVLGEGIDAPRIRVVIYIGVIDSLDDYGQQSGRAGRDRCTASEAVVLRKAVVGKDGRRRAEQSWKMEPQMREFLSRNVYRRVVMDRYMDGDRERRTCRSGEQFCNVCRGYGTKRVRAVEEEARAETKQVCREDKRIRNDESRWRLADERRHYAAIQSQQREARITQGRFVDEVEGLF